MTDIVAILRKSYVDGLLHVTEDHFSSCITNEELERQLSEAMAKYMADLEQQKAIKSHSVVCGSATSTVIFRDTTHKRWYKQRHLAGVHFTNGVEPRIKTFKGKWRKVKYAMRWWLRSTLQSMAADMAIQPVMPMEYISLSATVVEDGANFAVCTD
jgi:hypothetical protein